MAGRAAQKKKCATFFSINRLLVHPSIFLQIREVLQLFTDYDDISSSDGRTTEAEGETKTGGDSPATTVTDMLGGDSGEEGSEEVKGTKTTEEPGHVVVELHYGDQDNVDEEVETETESFIPTTEPGRGGHLTDIFRIHRPLILFDDRAATTEDPELKNKMYHKVSGSNHSNGSASSEVQVEIFKHFNTLKDRAIIGAKKQTSKISRPTPRVPMPAGILIHAHEKVKAEDRKNEGLPPGGSAAGKMGKDGKIRLKQETMRVHHHHHEPDKRSGEAGMREIGSEEHEEAHANEDDVHGDKVKVEVRGEKKDDVDKPARSLGRVTEVISLVRRMENKLPAGMGMGRNQVEEEKQKIKLIQEKEVLIATRVPRSPEEEEEEQEDKVQNKMLQRGRADDGESESVMLKEANKDAEDEEEGDNEIDDGIVMDILDRQAMGGPGDLLVVKGAKGAKGLDARAGAGKTPPQPPAPKKGKATKSWGKKGGKKGAKKGAKWKLLADQVRKLSNGVLQT